MKFPSHIHFRIMQHIISVKKETCTFHSNVLLVLPRTNLTRVHFALQEPGTHHVVSDGSSVDRRLVAHFGVDDFYYCLLQCRRDLSWIKNRTHSYITTG